VTFSVAQQLEEIERELALRRNVYPRMVVTHKMRQSVADFHMARLEAVRDTLKSLASGAVLDRIAEEG
jgi:hypothetical protein